MRVLAEVSGFLGTIRSPNDSRTKAAIISISEATTVSYIFRPLLQLAPGGCSRKSALCWSCDIVVLPSYPANCGLLLLLLLLLSHPQLKSQSAVIVG